MTSPTNRKGNQALSAVVLGLSKRGYEVYLPFGDGTSTDLVVDIDTKLIRVQVKTARAKDGVIVFRCYSFSPNSPGRRQARTYVGKADLFAVCNQAIGKCYIVPVNDAPSFTMSLRLQPAENNQDIGIKWAKDYELETFDFPGFVRNITR